MLKNKFSIRQFWLTNWSFLVHSTTRNALYVHPSHDSILELWRNFPNVKNTYSKKQSNQLSLPQHDVCKIEKTLSTAKQNKVQT